MKNRTGSATPDGRDSLGEKALLARGSWKRAVTFVLVSGAWGFSIITAMKCGMGRGA